MSSARTTRTPPRDVPAPNAVARGAAVAFFPLLLWGALGPLVASPLPSPQVAGFVLLIGVTACYVLAGFRAGSVALPAEAAWAGAGAGLVTYLLVLPINLFAGEPFDPLGLLVSALVATVVGWIAGRVGRQARERAS